MTIDELMRALLRLTEHGDVKLTRKNPVHDYLSGEGYIMWLQLKSHDGQRFTSSKFFSNEEGEWMAHPHMLAEMIMQAAQREET